ncbi:MAG TPA: TrmH family RNA methyltransferase [Caulobacteraceae bacterium]|jgi:tRNA (cytidine/uridine-2'-O-)-methyltransferase|nr:TrmH family RNA methyltransferase [Caulobacteraceae bacterium]
MRLALFQPDIPQNLGGALRLCACLAVNLEIIEPCGFPLTDRAIRRVAMDYAAMARVARHDSWDRFSASDARGERLVLFTTRAAQTFTTFDFRAGDVLLFGRESAGVPEAVHAAADARLVIPIAPPARSLNVVAAAAMALTEALRQTNGFPDPASAR